MKTDIFTNDNETSEHVPTKRNLSVTSAYVPKSLTDLLTSEIPTNVDTVTIENQIKQLFDEETHTSEFSSYTQSHNGGAKKTTKTTKAQTGEKRKANKKTSKKKTSKKKASKKKASKKRRKKQKGGDGDEAKPKKKRAMPPAFKAHVDLMAFLRKNVKHPELKGKVLMVFSKFLKEHVAKQNPELNDDKVKLCKEAEKALSGLSKDTLEKLVKKSKDYKKPSKK